jgi:hypothetical protein
MICLATACSSEREPVTDEVSEVENITANHAYDECGSLFYAAVYFIPQLSENIEWQGIVHGQPPHAIHEFLTDDEKGLLRDTLDELTDEIQHPGSGQDLTQLLTEWCRIYTLLLTQSDQSIEEFFADVYQTGEFSELFIPYNSRPVFLSDEADALDKIASLSSSEIHDLQGRWVTDMAFRSADERDYLLDTLGLHPVN